MLDEYVTADRELHLAFDSLVDDAGRIAQDRDDARWLDLISRQAETFVETAICKAHDALEIGDFREAVTALFNGASKLDRLAAGLNAPGARYNSPAVYH